MQESQAAWDRRITDRLARLAYWQALEHGYRARDLFLGPTLLFARPGEGGATLASGGAGGEWLGIASLVQPAELHEVLPEAGGTTGAAAGAGPAAAAARQIEAALLAAAAAADDDASPAAAAAAQGSSLLLTPRAPPSPAPFTPAASAAIDSDTTSIVLPLNRLCPERRYILRAGGRSGTPAALLTPPLTRIPLWLIGNETGGIGSSIKELAAALPLPCYGLALGGEAASLVSLAELAAHYVAAITAVQPHGPYLLAGCSVAGAALAHACAAGLQSAGQRAGLLLLDGCLGRPQGLTLHDPTW
jgi:hypothetical protein